MKSLIDIQNRQMDLPLSVDSSSTKAEKKGGNFSDPAFSNNKNLPIHRWVPWIAGFSREFVQDAISRYLENSGTVLDPFTGVGTTIVEAVLHGHNAVGFEINPYAAWACEAKVNSYQIDTEIFKKEVLNFSEFYKEKNSSNYNPISSPPGGFKTRSDFYSPEVLKKVLILQDFISTVTNTKIQELFKLAFTSTMVRYSNYSYEPSLGRRVSAGKSEIQNFPVEKAVLDKLMEMAKDISWYKEKVRGIKPGTKIINDSFFNYRTLIDPDSVDLIITSPPYLNNYHYNRNTRPHLYWLGYVKHAGDFKTLEESNFGKYWQTVRELERVELAFTLPESDLSKNLELLRITNSEKGIYGGNGWANYAATYFNDCFKFANGIKFALKQRGTALVVIGNSILQGIQIPTDQYFAEIAKLVGLELIRIDIPRVKRVGNSIIKSDVRVAKAKDSHQLYEAIVELRKP